MALLVVAALSRPDASAGPCAVTGRAALRDVPEASGLAVSRRHPNLIWTHNDSGNEPMLFAVDTAGTPRGQVRVAGTSRDWEDISAAPCSGGNCLYIGDIGDNDLARKSIQVLRIDEPATDGGQIRPQVIELTYPDGAHNAEAMFVANGRAFIVTRDRVGAVYESIAPIDGELSESNRSGVNIGLRRAGELQLAGVTDAEASPDGMLVAVRTYSEVAIYRTDDLTGQSRRQPARPANRIRIAGLKEPQGEGVALGEDGMLYLASEGQPWNEAGRFISLRCSTRLP